MSRYRKLEWTGSILCGISGALLLTRVFAVEGGYVGHGIVFGTERGSIVVGFDDNGHTYGWIPLSGPTLPMRMLPEIYTGQRETAVLVPLWIPAAIGVAAALYCHRLRKMPKPGHCRKCEYDLTGNVSGVCPECGTPAPIQTKANETATLPQHSTMDD